MKKIIALFVIMLAFGVTANAQQKKAAAPATAQETASNEAIQKAAARDLALMSETIQLTKDQSASYKGLFETKQRMLATPNLSDERKANIAQNIEMKIKSLLTSDQIAKLDSNPELLKKLVN